MNALVEFNASNDTVFISVTTLIQESDLGFDTSHTKSEVWLK